MTLYAHILITNSTRLNTTLNWYTYNLWSTVYVQCIIHLTQNTLTAGWASIAVGDFAHSICTMTSKRGWDENK